MIPAIKNKPVSLATAVLIFILVLIVALFSTKDVIAGSAATLVIKSRVDTGTWTTDSAIYPLKEQKVILKIDAIPGGTVRWYQIIPDISKIYKNCNHPWEKDPYKWVGLAKIDYSKKELAAWRGCWEIEPFSKKSQDTDGGQAQKSLGAPSAAGEEFQYYYKDVGSFWFQVEVAQGGAVQRSPGIEDISVKGLPPQVFRVSIRESGGFLGYLTSFFNVPGVFGSIPYQSNNYIGHDGSYKNFRGYLDKVFLYAGTASLSKELVKVSDPRKINPGEVFIQGGFPGHAVIAIDVSVNPAGERCFLLAQSFMPAQELHILKNPNSALSPWYHTQAAGKLNTPEWEFKYEDLKRFPEVDCMQNPRRR